MLYKADLSVQCVATGSTDCLIFAVERRYRSAVLEPQTAIMRWDIN